jgi:hypothetical protein
MLCLMHKSLGHCEYPNPTATSVVAMSSVRRLKHQVSHGAMADASMGAHGDFRLYSPKRLLGSTRTASDRHCAQSALRGTIPSNSYAFQPLINSAQLTDIIMAKKFKRKATRPLSNSPAEKNISISKQAVGGVTGAVLGAMVGGPVGAIAGGVAGTVGAREEASGEDGRDNWRGDPQRYADEGAQVGSQRDDITWTVA